MKVAVVGCLHGELDRMYATVKDIEDEGNFKVDLILCCGDFQAVRNKHDLNTMAVPPKHRRICDFWKYYAEIEQAPVLTIFVGGNHEASNYMQELAYGGWVAPNIWFMGYAGVVNFGGLRIGGLSGIYKQHDFTLGHFEHPPYSGNSMRSCYHIRNIEVFRLKQLERPVDIMLSHDWPRGVYNYGNLNALLRKKSFFREEVEDNTLGSRPTEELLLKLKPKYWFSAHLHCKFSGLIQHNDEFSSVTKFLALDKVLPGRDFLQILDIDAPPGDKVLKLDAEWLSVLRNTNHLFSLSSAPVVLPNRITHEKYQFCASEEDMKNLLEQFDGDLTVPDMFEQTAPMHKPDEEDSSSKEVQSDSQILINPQTDLLCAMCDLLHPNADFLGQDSGDISNLSEHFDTSISDSIDTVDDTSGLEPMAKPNSSKSQDPANFIASEDSVPSCVSSVVPPSKDECQIDLINELSSSESNEEYQPKVSSSFPSAKDESRIDLGDKLDSSDESDIEYSPTKIPR